MTMYHHAVFKCLLVLLVLALTRPGQAQWTKSETLTGGSIVTDMITFNGELYVAMVDVGIFKSTNDGNTWTKVAVPGQPNFVHFAIAGSNLLAVSYGKTFSTSNGEQWSEGAGPEAFINDVACDGSEKIFASTSNGIYQSVDGGTTWSRNSDPQTHLAMKSIAVKGNTVWAGTDAPVAGRLLNSNDGGMTWSTTDRGTTVIGGIALTGDEIFLNIPYDGIYKSSNHGVDWQLSRNLKDSEGQLHASTSGLYYFSRYKLYTSKNAGSTWSEKAQAIPLYNSQTLFTTDEHIFVGLWGGGIVRTTLSGNSDWQLVNNGIAVHNINDILVEGTSIYAGLESSFIRSTQDGGLTWDQKKDTYGILAGSGRALLSTESELYVGSGGGGVQRSSNEGATWILKNNGLISQNILQFAKLGNKIFVATDDGVYKSLDKGDTWRKMTDGDMAMPRTLYSDGTNLYVGTYDGLFVSRDGGTGWARISIGLASESINSIVNIGSVLFAASQYGGLYRTANFGESWEKVSDEYVVTLAARNNTLFFSTLDNELLVSSDSGLTAEDIGASLPGERITAIEFTKELIVIGNHYSGVWTRSLTEVVPPHLLAYSTLSSDKFLIGSTIFVEADQRLYSDDGTALSDVMSYIKVTKASGAPAPYSAEIDVENKLITLNIADAIEGESYTVSIEPLYNEFGLSSSAMSQTFTATVNHVPRLQEASVEASQGQVLAFNSQVFSAAFSDEDGDVLAKLMVKGLPSHGTLKLGNTPVILDQEITTASLDLLTYTAQNNFSGKDHWFWNGSDGTAYASAEVKMTINITPITSVLTETSWGAKLYPNPVTSTLNIITTDNHPFAVDVIDIVGGEVIHHAFQTAEGGTPAEVNLAGLPPGLYIVRIQSPMGPQIQHKIVKQ